MTVADKKEVAPSPTGTQAEKAPLASEGAGGPESVDRIRQIIFGAQMEDYERRFSQLEKRLVQESAEIRKDLVKQFQNLEAALQREVDRLSKQLTAERDSRVKAAEKLSKKMLEEDRKLEAKIVSGGDRFDKLLKSAEEKAKKLLQDRFSRLQERIEELKGDKTDRAALARILRGAAEQLENSKKS